jgi:hypothetical protein
VVGPSPRSGEAVTLPESRLSPSPGVGRGGDRLPESRLSPSPGVGRGGDRLPVSWLSPSPGVGRGGDRLPVSRWSPSPGVRRGGDRLPESRWSPRRRPSSGVEVEFEPCCRARRSFLWRPRLDLAAVSSPWWVAQQSEQGRRRCFPVRSVSGAAK